MQSSRHLGSTLFPMLLGAVVIVTVGCGGSSNTPDLYEVSGTVTMDGQPLPNASVQFIPQEGDGRPSWGMTDEEGYYEMGYSGATMGVLPGEHIVKISTARDAEEDPTTGEMSEGSPETVPDVYRSADKLTANVTEDGQTIDFQLNSQEGDVTQPEFTSELDVLDEEF